MLTGWTAILILRDSFSQLIPCSIAQRKMEAEDLRNFSAANDLITSTEQSVVRRRSICTNCSRPNRVCLCQYLPAEPIPTNTQVVILQHPHEAQHKLSTTPLLAKCLLNSTVIVNRKLRPGLSPLLDRSPPALYLFPPTFSSPSTNLSNLDFSTLIQKERENLVLVVFDGTWKHAKEMVSASEGFLSRFATRVCLDFDENVEGGSIYNSELILRKEPFGGCVSTMEAVARCLRVLEGNGAEVEGKLIEVLKNMARFQAGYLKPVKLRPRLAKRNAEEKKERDLNVRRSLNLLGD